MSPNLKDKVESLDSDKIFKELTGKIKSYNPNVDLKLLDKAYSTAKKYHDNQFRKSGEPFIIHPLSVGMILADIELDQTSIAAAILHDVVEDTEYNLEKVTSEFGNSIARIINGVTKLDKLVFDTKEEQQVSNIRKMIKQSLRN